MTRFAELLEDVLGTVVQDVRGLRDPAARYTAAHQLADRLADVAKDLRAIRADAATALHDDGHDWADVGALVGVGRQRASQHARYDPTKDATP